MTAAGIAIAPEDQASRLRALVESSRGQAASPAPARARRTAPPPRIRGVRTPIITMTSGKGGVGKTCTAVNLAIALASLGTRTTLVDADLGTANADLLCGLAPTRRLDKAVAGRASGLSEIAVDAPGGFRLVPGAVGVARAVELSDGECSNLIHSLESLERESDALLIDTGAGVGPDVLGFVRIADISILVVTPEPTSIADAYALIKSVSERGGRADSNGQPPVAGFGGMRFALVVNQTRARQDAKRVHARLDGVCRKFLGRRLPLLGCVCRDDRVSESVLRRQPLLLHYPKSQSAKDLRQLADTLAGGLPLRRDEPKRRSRGVFSRRAAVRSAPPGGAGRATGP